MERGDVSREGGELNDDDTDSGGDFFFDMVKTIIGVVIVALLGVAIVHIVWSL